MRYFILLTLMLFVGLPSVACATDKAALLEEIDALREAAEGYQVEAQALRQEADELRVALAEKDEVILNLKLEVESLQKIIGTHKSDLDAKEAERLAAYTNWQDTEKELKTGRALWVGSISTVGSLFAGILIKNAVDANATSN